MGNSFSFAWEDNLIVFLQQYMSKPAVKVAGIITEFGDAVILVGIIGLFYWALNKEFGKKLVVYLGIVNIVNPCLKSVARRLRPYMVNRDIQCLKPVNSEGDIYDVVSQEYSFPSGHAVNSVAVYGPLMKHSKQRVWKIILACLIALVGVSRFVLGVHYPTDVIAGWLLALVCVKLYSLLENKLGRYRMYILLDIIGLAGFLVAKTNDFYTGYGLMLGATLGVIYEEKNVNFEGTKKAIPVILRTAVGAGLYVGLNSLMKMPFSEEFLNSGTTPAFAVRAIRYAITVFLLIGVYPMSFRLFRKKNKE